MTLYNNQTTPTAEELAKTQATQLIDDANRAYSHYESSVKNFFMEFWSNGDPCLTIKYFGTDAAKMFQDHYETQLYLKSKNPNYEMLNVPELYTVTFKEDGSGEITKNLV